MEISDLRAVNTTSTLSRLQQLDDPTCHTADRQVMIMVMAVAILWCPNPGL